MQLRSLKSRVNEKSIVLGGPDIIRFLRFETKVRERHATGRSRQPRLKCPLRGPHSQDLRVACRC